jgi:hypothetical protein
VTAFLNPPGETPSVGVPAELTARPTGTVLLDVGTDPGYGLAIPAQIRHLVSRVPQRDGSIRAAEQWFAHGLADHLAPGTRYHYRLRLPDGTVTPDAVFGTAPAAGARVPFSFTAFGDQGVNTGPAPFSDDYYKPDDTRRTPAPASTMVGLIARRAPAFHLLAGDTCYADPGGTGQRVRAGGPNGFDDFDPTLWTTYFASIEPSAATSPWMFATGNHDMEALYDDNTAPGGATHGYGGHAARLDLPGTWWCRATTTSTSAPTPSAAGGAARTPRTARPCTRQETAPRTCAWGPAGGPATAGRPGSPTASEASTARTAAPPWRRM